MMEEAPEVEIGGNKRPWQLLLLSAKTEAGLERAGVNLARHLRHRPELELADVAYTLQRGRQAFPYRRVLVCRSVEEAAEGLEKGGGEGQLYRGGVEPAGGSISVFRAGIAACGDGVGVVSE